MLARSGAMLGWSKHRSTNESWEWQRMKKRRFERAGRQYVIMAVSLSDKRTLESTAITAAAAATAAEGSRYTCSLSVLANALNAVHSRSTKSMDRPIFSEAAAQAAGSADMSSNAVANASRPEVNVAYVLLPPTTLLAKNRRYC